MPLSPLRLLCCFALRLGGPKPSSAYHLVPNLTTGFSAVPLVNISADRPSFYKSFVRMKVTPMAGVVNKFLGHVMPGIIRPLRVLWNEVVGFLFLVFAVLAGSSTFNSIRQLH